MKNRCNTGLLTLLVGTLLTACGGSDEFTADDHVEEVLEWREGRFDRLTDPEGYLYQTGLFWLPTGTHTFGGDARNDIVFPGDAPADIGFFTVDDDGVVMRIIPGVEVRHGLSAVTEMPMPADVSGEDVVVSLGSLSWQVIERAGRFAVRLRDSENAFADSFGPLPYYDVDPAYRVEATLHRYAKPIQANVGTVIEGLGYHPESPGVVGFDIDGETFVLEAYAVGDRLFYVFGDLTNRDDTYGAGRFLYSDLPAADDTLTLDFNKAYSPPCAFNDFSTCPIASSKNRLSIRVEAGEKYDPALHYGAAH